MPRPFSQDGTSITQVPTITAGAYSAKDAVGGLLTFANAARAAGGTGIIHSLTLADKADAKAVLELWLFDRTFAAVADNAAFDPTDAELLTCVGVIPIAAADYFSAADNGAACVRNINLQYMLKSDGTALFGQLKCIATPTYASTSDLSVTLAIEYRD